MKLGIILYGITRDQAAKTAPVFRKEIINPLAKLFDVTIFCHALILKNCEIDWYLNPNTMPIKNPNDFKLFNPDYFSSTDQSLWSKSFDYQSLIRNAPNPSPRSGYVAAKNYINALYSLNQSFKQTNQNPCDLYFISRLDLLYQNNLGIKDACLNISKNLDKNILYSPSWGQNGGLNDRFAIGNRYVSQIYCNRLNDYLIYKKIIKNGRCLGFNIHAESMLERCSRHHKFQNVFFDCKAYRLRINGSMRKG